jgi:hypothetical protein
MTTVHFTNTPLLSHIYAKTPKGENEIVRPKFGLNPRQRRILTFVDGARPLSPLHGQFPVQEMEDIVTVLTRQDFIFLIGEKLEEPASAENATEQGLAARHAFQWTSRTDAHQPGFHDEHRAALTHNSEKVQKAKEFMLETAAVHLGILGRDIIGKISSAESAHALASFAGQWTMALCASKTAARYAQLYLEQLKILLFEDQAEASEHYFF